MYLTIIGATGATGKNLLEMALKDDYFTKVDVFVRRNVSLSNEKLTVHVIDFDKPDEWEKNVTGDVLFSCLGTTRRDAGGKKSQWKVDYDYQYRFAKAASEKGVQNYVLVSSDFASSKSIFFYTKMKGKLEDEIIKLGFRKIIIFRPPAMERENSDRPAEALGIKIIRFLNSIGILKSFAPLRTDKLAEAMINALKRLPDGVHIISRNEISNYTNK
ncbi:MAG: NAD(P)H-binding protein [Melioribacter sp.]|uniref:NAD(P)H-binding protein n=1 Tax=Melioribacter sp. TaxID=2052167 RepID=UPI003BD8A80F